MNRTGSLTHGYLAVKAASGFCQEMNRHGNRPFNPLIRSQYFLHYTTNLSHLFKKIKYRRLSSPYNQRYLLFAMHVLWSHSLLQVPHFATFFFTFPLGSATSLSPFFHPVTRSRIAFLLIPCILSSNIFLSSVLCTF